MKFIEEMGTERIVFDPSDGKCASYRIPGIAALKDGTLLCCCESRSDPHSDWGSIDVLVLRSLDRGTTWQESLRVCHEEKGHVYGNPTFIVEEGRLHLIYHLDYSRAFVIHSENSGESWSEATEITDTYRAFPYEWNVCATGPGHGICTKDGRLIAPIWLAMGEIAQDGTKKHFPSVAGYVYSRDHGETWFPGLLAPELEDGNETTIASLDDGSVLFNFRTRSDVRKRFIATLDAQESAFHDMHIAQELKDPWCFGSMVDISSDTIFYVHCDSTFERRPLAIHQSCDQGKTWQYLCQVSSVGGYADIAYANGRLYVLFERVDPSNKCVQNIMLKTYKTIV